MPDQDFVGGHLFARRGARRWRGRERTSPKMPSGPWRAAALLCTGAGVVIAWLLFRDSSAVGWRMFAGGVIGLGAGMYAVESIWERRLRASEGRGPIGPRS